MNEEFPKPEENNELDPKDPKNWPKIERELRRAKASNQFDDAMQELYSDYLDAIIEEEEEISGFTELGVIRSCVTQVRIELESGNLSMAEYLLDEPGKRIGTFSRENPEETLSERAKETVSEIALEIIDLRRQIATQKKSLN